MPSEILMTDKIRKNTVTCNSCRVYDRKIACLFVDGELEPDRAFEFERHTGKCAECRNLVSVYRRTRDILHSHAETVQPRSGRMFMQERVLEKLEKRQPFTTLKWNRTGIFSKKILKPAFIAAIIVVGVFLLHSDTVRYRGPSAIVNSVDSETASIMIMETQKEKHTIIWFSRS